MNEKQVFQADLQILKDAILNFPKNAIIANLNLNSLRNKTRIHNNIPSITSF